MDEELNGYIEGEERPPDPDAEGLIPIVPAKGEDEDGD